MNEVYWDKDEYAYVIKEKLSNRQTVFIMFQELEESNSTIIYYNVALGIYNKRKHIDRNEDEKRITGTASWSNAIKIIKMFDKIEQYVVEENKYRGFGTIILVHWVDNRRRDAYYSVLKKRGYSYGMAFGKKHLIKKISPP